VAYGTQEAAASAEAPPSLVVLGIETSCDETAAAIVARDAEGRGRILASVVRSQWELHRPFGGVVPELAARAHVECLDLIVAEALARAGIGWAGLDAVAVTAGPGLVGGLMVGVVTAEAIALAHGLPLLAVNHLEAHALTVGLTEGLQPPYLLLLVSGGHTQTLLVEAVGRYRRLGTTIDDALGEAFDKTAKLLGLGQPGGPAVERLAAQGDKQAVALPRPMLGRAEPHFSFAGLKTAVRQAAHRMAPLNERGRADLCASFQRAVADTVRDRVARAMDLAERSLDPQAPRRLVVAGGVAANRTLREALASLAGERGYALHAPPIALCTDNGAMIAWAGGELYMRGRRDGPGIVTRARWPLDGAATPALGAGRHGPKA
jgi:N6-L-threonylcarbamoyladenine synthase